MYNFDTEIYNKLLKFKQKGKKEDEDYTQMYLELFGIQKSPCEARKRLYGVLDFLNTKDEFDNEKDSEVLENQDNAETKNIISTEPENECVAKRKYVPKVYKNNNNIRLAVLSGDKHFKYEDKHAIDIMYQICEDYKDYIDEFIDGGDGINNDSLSKWDSTEEEVYTLFDEIKAFEKHMWNFKKLLPNAKFVIVEDNHYHLRKKKFIAANPAMKNMIKDIDFPFDIQMPHGVLYFPFEQNRIGVIHGLRTNVHFAKAHSELFKEDVINFHTHGSQHFTCKNGSKAIGKQAQKMWGMPSMCKQMDYMNGSPSRSNTGLGMLWYDLEYNTYDLHYIFVENKVAIYNGKRYVSRIESEVE